MVGTYTLQHGPLRGITIKACIGKLRFCVALAFHMHFYLILFSNYNGPFEA